MLLWTILLFLAFNVTAETVNAIMVATIKTMAALLNSGMFGVELDDAELVGLEGVLEETGGQLLW